MANARLLRDIHEAGVLNYLRVRGETSRAGLAAALGLTRSTLTNLVNNLLEAGYVTETGSRASPRGAGRPGIGINLRADGAHFIGADIGERILRVVLLDLGSNIIDERTASFEPSERPIAVLERLRAIIEDLRSEHSSTLRLKGVGVTVPGTCFDGRIVLSPALDWEDVPVRDTLSSSVDVPILVENAANAAALAETYFDPTYDPPNIVYLLLRDGVGAGIVIDGEIYHGTFGAAGEIGNIRLAPEGPVDTKGNRGTFEAFCGQRTLLKDFVRRGGASATLESLMSELAAGTEAATGAVSEWQYWLAQGLLAILNVLNPRGVVLGGSLTAVARHALPAVTRVVRAENLPGSQEISIGPSALGEDTGALGGAMLVYHTLFSLPQLD